MSKELKRDTFRVGKMTRVHPDSQFQQHQIHDEHDATRPSSAESIEQIDDDELESVSTVDRHSSVHSEVNIRAETPPVELIRVPATINNPSRLTVQRKNHSSSVILLKPLSVPQPSFRSYVLTPNFPVVRKASWMRSNTILVKDKVTQKWVSAKEKQMPVLKAKPINIPFLSLLLAVGMAFCTIIILAIFLSRKQNEESLGSNSYTLSSCAINCMMSLTPFLASTIASWPFDGSLSDTNNVYPGLYTNPPSVTYGTGNFGKDIYLDGTNYVYTSTHFMNLSYQSWTIEGWVLLSDLSTERGIFGQCDSSSTTDRCLSLSIKNQRLHLSFYNDDLNGVTYLTTSSNNWHHVAFVYDYTLMEQLIYLDGILDATTGTSGIAVGPYKGSSGQVTIGWTTGGYYFNGYIDDLQVSSGAKTACEILNDATLTAYYAFDVGASYMDSTVNVLHGTANSLISVSGRVNYAYSFQYATSYFQSVAFTAYAPSETFSVALWVKPFVVNGGTLIHLSTNIGGSSLACFDLLGFSSSGQLVGQLYNSYAACCPVPMTMVCPCQGTANVGGPTMLVNTWTHIVLTYSSSNGLILYTNGTLRGVTDSFSSFPSASPDYKSRPYMTVGNQGTSVTLNGCLIGSPSLSPGAYQGIIDELQIYSRELTKTEICSLFQLV